MTKKHNELSQEEKIKNTLEIHKKWINGEAGGRKAQLENVDLKGVNLYKANLYRANLYRAKLDGANLEGANLRDTDLAGADLYRANLKEADLREADLRLADLRNANLTGAKFDESFFHIQDGLLKEIAEIVVNDESKIVMNNWHSECKTTHCLAGWACHINPVAKALEKELGTEIAGLKVLGQEAHSYFFGKNKEVMDYLKSVWEESK